MEQEKLSYKAWTTEEKRKKLKMFPCGWGSHCQPDKPPKSLEASQPTSSSSDRHCTASLYMAVSYFSPIAGVVPLTNPALTEDPQAYIASQSPAFLIILGNADHLLMCCSCLASRPLGSVLALYFNSIITPTTLIAPPRLKIQELLPTQSRGTSSSSAHTWTRTQLLIQSTYKQD